MRVTNNMLVNTLLRNVNNNLQTMQKKQDQLSTGKRVSAPSDDPVAVSKILKYKTKINELEQYDRNAKDALSWTQTSELAIADISDALNRARELAVQASSDSYSQSEREKIAQEIEQLKDHIIGNSNKSYAGKYIFSSYQTDKKLLNEDGSFNIDITKKELIEKPRTIYEVGVGETLEVSTNGVDIFGALELGNNIFANKLPVDENTGKLPEKAAIKGTFDLTADYTVDDLNVTFNGVEYDVFEATPGLDGSTTPLTKVQVLSAFKNAKDSSFNYLTEVASVYFDEDELVIESKDYENDTIEMNATNFSPEPMYTSFNGGFVNTDYSSVTPDPTITYNDGVNPPITFSVSLSSIDGNLSNAEIINVFESGEALSGEKLSEYADVKYDGTDLIIQPIADGDIDMTFSMAAYNPTKVQGKEIIEAKVEGLDTITDSEVLASNGDYDFTLTYNGQSEKISVDTSKLKSTEDLQTAIQDELNSVFGSNKLEVSITDDDVFRIKTKNSSILGDSPSIKIDVPQIQENLFAERFPSEEAKGVAGKSSLIKGSFDLEYDYTNPTDNLDVTFGGSTYIIDESTLELNGTVTPLTKEEVVDAFRNADNGVNELSEVANIYYNSDNELVIQSKDRVNVDIEVAGSSFDPKAAYTSLKGTLDFSGEPFNTPGDELKITYDDGSNDFTFDIDQTLLDSTLTDVEIEEIFENGVNSDGEPLSMYANVNYDGGNLLIQPIEDKNVQMTSTSVPADIYQADLLDGKELIEAKVIGTETISDLDVESADGDYDFVMSYNGITERISIEMDDLTDVDELRTAIQSEIDATFGLGNIEVELNDGDVLKLKTLGTPNDGSIPTMEFRPIRSNKPTMMQDLDNFIEALKNDNREEIRGFITSVDKHLNNVNASRSAIGAKTNRLEMILRRIGDDSINVTQLLSNSQDVDMAETIMLLKNAENVYKASLSAGARVIQPSLLDFLR